VTPRHPLLVSAFDEGQRVARGGALDISGGGLGCYLWGPSLSPGEEVLTRLNVHGQGHRVLKAVARVAWARTVKGDAVTRYGLTWCDGEDLAEIRETIPSLA